MNIYEVCVIGLCFAVLENAVTGNYCENYPARLAPLAPPFYFGYLSIDPDYNMVLKLKNVPQKITAVFVTVATDDPVSKNKYKWVRYNYEGEEFRICGNTTNSKVTISLELVSSNGLCATRLVSEGRHVMTLRYGLADSTYKPNHACLYMPDNSCAIELDLRRDCIESETYPNAERTKSYVIPTHSTTDSRKPNSKIPNTPRQTQRTSGTTSRKSKITKPAISYTPKVTQNVRNTSRTLNHKIPDTPRPSQSTLDASRHASSIPKSTFSYTPKTTQHIPNSIQNILSILLIPLLTPKTAHNYSDNSRNTFITPKPVISHTQQAPKNISNTLKSKHNISEDHNKNTTCLSDISKAALNTSDSQQAARNIPVTTNATRVTSDTSNAEDLRTDVAAIKKYITITISSAVSVTVLILLVVVTRKCCLMKRNTSGSSQLLTNDLGGSPFYLNMLFRKECDLEIEQIEQHHYEQIDPQYDKL